jgi:hypothetical protein
MKRIAGIIFTAIVGLSYSCLAQGDLLITPSRIVFEGNKQKEEISLVNMGNDTATYSISFVQKSMREDGSFVLIEKPDSGQMFAEPYLRIFPRTVTLAPGEPQVIIVQFRRKPDMADGEYRSHLYFRSEKNYQPLGIKNKGKDTTLVSVQLIPIFGMSIPVIIRTGIVKVNTMLSNPELENYQDTIQTLKITINRTGNISTYGDIQVQYIPLSGKPYTVGIVAGVGVYTNLSRRFVTIRLKNTSGKILTNGKLKIQYVSNGEARRVVYAETEMEIK